MIVLSHRGYWKTANEKNTEVAFERSFDLGFGTETDLRDVDGKLVISHDIPLADALSFARFQDIVAGRSLPLALNIKADGLAKELADSMAGADRRSWFVFDMAVPDMREHMRVGNPVFSRLSEVESINGWMSEAEGVWLDAFENDQWYELALIEQLFARGKRVCVVSPELHKRPHLPTWTRLRELGKHDDLMICSDFPEEARQFFAA